MDDLPTPEDRLWVKAFLVIRLPFMLLQRATIPLTSQEHFSRHWLIISITLSPFMTVVYFNLSAWLDICLAILIGVLCGTLIAFATRGTLTLQELRVTGNRI